MKCIEYNLKSEIDVINSAEIVVVGGGPGGLGAAVTAARTGHKTILIERYSAPGGMANQGEVMPFMRNHVNEESLDRLVYLEWIEEMKKYNPHTSNGSIPYKDRVISSNSAALAAEDMLLKAGVNLLYHHTLVDVVSDNNSVKHIILHSKSGFTAVEGKVFIDCTGDGDLAALAGCEFEFGNDQNNCQPMTLCFKLANVDISRMPERETINQLFDNAKKAGEINNPRENILYFLSFEDDVVHFNTTRVVRKSGINGKELSEAEIEGRKQFRELFKFLREKITGFEKCEIKSIASHIGIRETRRIKGNDYIDRNTFVTRGKFADSIAKVNYCIDIHSPDGEGTELIYLEKDEWYEIPFGCIVAKDKDNLLIGGRPISADHAIHSSLRVMPPAISIGCAAGMAASMSLEYGKAVDELDGVEVHDKLKGFGADL
ncbi:MAG: FAD-dependent oxidoreductase [Planctomycetota bacterium]|jgi:hypothetical protein